MYLTIAAGYVSAKIRLDKVPELVDTAYRLMMDAESQYARDDRITVDAAKLRSDRAVYFAEWRAAILLDCYEATKEPDKARELDEQLQGMAVQPMRKPFQLLLHARAREIEGRKLDALLLYRAAIAAQTFPSVEDADNTPEYYLKRLWKEMGGTDETYSAFLGGVKSGTAPSGDWERPAHALPAFSLPDAQGKTWSISDWSGKTVVVSVWATWCPPCREELPKVEKFYQQVKDRKDIAVITFNADEDVTKVTPYIKENKFTFPVFLARNIVTTVSDKGLPQTWIVDRHGSLQWIWTSLSPNWQETIQAKLDEMKKQAN